MSQVKSAVLGVLVALTLLTCATAPAAAQIDAEPINGSDDGQDGGNETQAGAAGDAIDANTVLIDSEYREGDGEVAVTIQSDLTQDITVSDVGAFIEGGEVPQRTVRVDAGETTTIAVPVTEVDGLVGVSIKTRETLYAEPLEYRDTGGNPFARTSSTTGWLGGASAAAIMTGLAAYRVRNRDPTEPEQME